MIEKKAERKKMGRTIEVVTEKKREKWIKKKNHRKKFKDLA